MRKKNLQIHVTDEELASIRDAAKKADMTMSDYGRKRLLSAMLDKRNVGDAERLAELLRDRERRDTETLAAIQNFQRLFIDAMELNLMGKLTVARLQGMVARRSA